MVSKERFLAELFENFCDESAQEWADIWADVEAIAKRIDAY